MAACGSEATRTEHRAMAVVPFTETVRLTAVAVKNMRQARAGARGLFAAAIAEATTGASAAARVPQVVVTTATAVTVPCIAVQHEKRKRALIEAKVAHVPVTRMTATGADVEVDAILVGPVRVTALRELIGVIEAEAARLPPAVPAAPATATGTWLAGLMALVA